MFLGLQYGIRLRRNKRGGSVQMRITNVLRWCLVLGIAAMWATAAAAARHASCVSDQALRDAGQDAGEWLTNGRDYTEQRYSPLKEIDAGNVSKLGLAWYYDTDSDRGTVETTPIVSNGVLYRSEEHTSEL